MILKRQIIGCLADLMEYKKAAKLFTQWNSQVTMKGALRLLLELWQSEQQAARNLAPDGVIQDLDQPLNPRTAVDMEDGDGSTITSTSHLATKFRHAKNFADTLGGQSVQSSPSANRTTVTKGFERASATAQEHQGSRWLKNDGGEQDSRAKIYSVLKCIGFECQETLSIAERQQMELVKLYPMAVELEMWIKVQESLASRGIKPVSADRQWITDSVSERKDQAAWVQSLQRQLAAERQREEEAGLDRFYKDLRGRAQIQRVTPPNGYPDDPLEGRGDEWSDEWSDDPDSP